MSSTHPGTHSVTHLGRRSGGRLTRALVALTATITCTTSAAPASAAATAVARPVRADVRVASFNIQNVSLDRTVGQQRPWKVRRSTVISQILAEHVDVIGVQEAQPSTYFASRLVDGKNQYLDLRNGLNKAGGHYAVANPKAFDCVNPVTRYHCRYKDQNASGGERILYNTRRLTKLRVNAMRYRAQAGRGAMYLAWAWFRVNATGHKFLFTTTHLEPSSRSVREAQWHQLIRKVNAIKSGHPVVAVGDFNVQKFDPMAARLLPAMKRAGYGDVLNQQYAVNPSRHVRAERRVNGWLNTYNHLTRDVRVFGYERRHDKTGNGIDLIFATNSLRIKKYKVVCNFDPVTLRVRGTLPSDHNMIRATIAMP
jgi:endonuclease/exonuclease/phosphatase family metal-dependent hydrolase